MKDTYLTLTANIVLSSEIKEAHCHYKRKKKIKMPSVSAIIQHYSRNLRHNKTWAITNEMKGMEMIGFLQKIWYM